MKRIDSFQIHIAYYLGIAADALWAVALFVPSVLTLLTGESDFANPNLPLRIVLYVAGVLMSGWTILLVWAVQRPLERRFVALLTFFVVTGMMCTSVYGAQARGSKFTLWIVLKTAALMAAFLQCYRVSGRVAAKEL